MYCTYERGRIRLNWEWKIVFGVEVGVGRQLKQLVQPAKLSPLFWLSCYNFGRQLEQLVQQRMLSPLFWLSWYIFWTTTQTTCTTKNVVLVVLVVVLYFWTTTGTTCTISKVVPVVLDVVVQQLMHTCLKTWILPPITWSASARQIEAKKRDGEPKMHSDHRVWARKIPVWATENPVTLSVSPQTPTLRPLNEGDFRGREGGFLIDLTKQRHSP